jgi:hypothetical protein
VNEVESKSAYWIARRISDGLADRRIRYIEDSMEEGSCKVVHVDECLVLLFDSGKFIIVYVQGSEDPYFLSDDNLSILFKSEKLLATMTSVEIARSYFSVREVEIERENNQLEEQKRQRELQVLAELKAKYETSERGGEK